MYSGIVIGTVMLLALEYYGIQWEITMVAGLCLSPLPYMQMHFQRKWFKTLARTGLGIGSAFFIGAPLLFAPQTVTGLILRVFILTTYVILARHALSKRQEKIDRPCDTCTEGVFPLCSWNKDKIIMASNDDSLDDEGREFLQMVAQSVCAPPNDRMVVALSASDFD
jgi:hypothetical protein